MARSISHAKGFVSLVADNLSTTFARRGYAAATQGMLRVGSGRIGKESQKDIGRSGETSWVPDPVTGYYRPSNQTDEIDVAELRELMLKQRITPE